MNSIEPLSLVLKCLGVLRVASLAFILGKEKLAANTPCQYFATL
jgi:hypothetical protein